MFEGLLLSRDDAVIRMFRRIYQEMELAGLEVCTGAEQAQQELHRKRFHAIIVDCDDVHKAPEVLGSIRKTAPNQRSTIFAILNGITTMRGAFEMGANLTLQKPMSLEHVRKSLRALRAMMEQEHRRYFRVPVDIPATLLLVAQALTPGGASPLLPLGKSEGARKIVPTELSGKVSA